MQRRRLAFCTVLLVLGIAHVGASPQQTAAGQQPSFRSNIVVVPIDVRVIDNKTGKTVGDLKAEDFTLLEDGAPQPIRLFEKHNYTPQNPPANARIPVRESAFGTTEQNNRIFLIVFGRGRHNLTTSKPLDALRRFVREQLLPQDQVAVFAYDRATDFTTDHEQIAQLIDRFEKAHAEIDMDVRLQVENGLAGLYGSRALPRNVQAKIDTVFRGAGLLASREIGKGETASTKRADADAQRAAGDLQRADVNQKTVETADWAAKNLGTTAGASSLGTWSAVDEVTSQMFTTLTLEDFMQNNAQSLQDLGNCYAGIEYLRHLEGEKHLVFVTERGMNLPRLEDDTDLAAAANDARVAIHTFQTGGIQGQQGGAPEDHRAETFAFRALRTIADLSGGTSSIGEQGIVAIDRLDDATRNDYVLGYYPSMARLDGTYRKVEVKVKRPDSTVLFRHGYFARRDVTSFNRRDFITNQRMQAAAAYTREIKDIKLKLNASLERNPAGGHQLLLNVGIDPTKLGLSVENGKHVGALDILVMTANDKGEPMGQFYQRANIQLADDMYQKLLKGNGIPYSVRLDTNPGVRNVHVIVYDYKADLTGRADARVY